MTSLTKTPITLKPCTFCGGAVELKTWNNIFGMKAARVTCVLCHCSSDVYTEGKSVAFEGIPSRCVTLEECIDRATRDWNQRI